MSRFRPLLVAALIAAVLPAAATESDASLGRWQIIAGAAAPWAQAPVDSSRLLGRHLQLSAGNVEGPAPLACANAVYEPTEMPAEGLFQGMLADPRRDALLLGFDGETVPGWRLRCDSGVFEFHARGDALVFALDNVLWTLQRADTDTATPGAPEAVVRALLQRHFAGELMFAPAQIATLRGWISPSLHAGIDAYLNHDFAEEPPITGDPLTDSQEPPQGFEVGRARRVGDIARVPVRFDAGPRARLVIYELSRHGAGWRIDEVLYEDGATLSELLAQR